MLVAVASCGLGSPTSYPFVEVPSDQTNLVGNWRDASGQVLPNGSDRSNEVLVIVSEARSMSCNEENVTVVLTMSWPPGRELDQNTTGFEDHRRQFLRDSTAAAAIPLEGESDLDADLPTTAKDTTIHRERNRLYTDPSDPSAIWIERGDGTVERWPRIREFRACG
ncbi:MAG TPA: hypothetical protein VIP98_09930 [Microlunatus sp.]